MKPKKKMHGKGNEMWNVYTDSEPQAKKEYPCDAWVSLLRSGYAEFDYHPKDWAIIQKARAEDGRILIGSQYLKRKGIWERKPCTFRARMDLHKICLKYDLYDDE